ncbi:uncharacterized protein TNCV_1851311 [Trichonephila clavipes]|nr:uncharacterized protein TNCV_1851311 [Trichonephila clavipes]
MISDNGLQFISDIFEHLSNRLGIRHVKTVVYRPQANRTERVNSDHVQMIANYVNDQHDTWDQFLRECAYAIRTAVNETTGKSTAELFLGRKLTTPLQKLVMVSDGIEFAVQDIEKWFDEARRYTKAKHEKWAKYYARRRRDVQIEVNDYKSDEKKEIRTSSFDSNSSRYKSSTSEGVQPRSSESQYRRKNGSGERRELEKKGTGLKKDQGEKHTSIANNRRPLVRSHHPALGQNQIEEQKRVERKLAYKRSLQSGSGGPERKYRKSPRHQCDKRKLTSVNSSDLLYFRKRCRREETVESF